jgi:hypothetical protein
MPQLQPDSPDQADQDYNHDGGSGTADMASGELHVIVPPDPPEFGPAAARALLRLLIDVYRNRGSR